MSDITVLLERINAGNAAAFDELVPLVYEELRRQANRYLPSRRDGEALQPTELVHEAFLKLVGGDADWHGSRHFYNAAALVMRQILVSHARTVQSQKRSATGCRIPLEDLPEPGPIDDIDWEALDAALGELQQRDPRRYQVVMLRYFCGLTDAQVVVQFELSTACPQSGACRLLERSG
jgi:RNA polymerase sigma-70 factor (ECF subfamily)